jgi:hypothetical protein
VKLNFESKKLKIIYLKASQIYLKTPGKFLGLRMGKKGLKQMRNNKVGQKIVKSII